MGERWEVLDLAVGQVVHDSYVDGVRVLVMRGPSALCAYCGVPSKHPLAGHSYDNLAVDCHGGLTYASEGKEGSGWPEGFYWYGWDYSHSGDRSTHDYKDYMLSKFPLSNDEKEWTIKEVVDEARWVAYDFARLMRLAEAIASKAMGWKP